MEKKYSVIEIRAGTEELNNVFETLHEAEETARSLNDKVKLAKMRHKTYCYMYDTILEALENIYKDDPWKLKSIMLDEGMQNAYKHQNYKDENEAFEWFYNTAWKPAYDYYYNEIHYSNSTVGDILSNGMKMNRLFGHTMSTQYNPPTNEDEMKNIAREIWNKSSALEDFNSDVKFEVKEIEI